MTIKNLNLHCHCHYDLFESNIIKKNIELSYNDNVNLKSSL
jgi:hypothetical protein